MGHSFRADILEINTTKMARSPLLCGSAREPAREHSGGAPHCTAQRDDPRKKTLSCIPMDDVSLHAPRVAARAPLDAPFSSAYADSTVGAADEQTLAG